MDPLTTLVALCDALDERENEVDEAEDWYEGEHPLPDPPPNTAAATDMEARKAFRAMASLSITNFIPPVVNVPAARLNIEGFRFSATPTSTDTDAWDIWRRNFLDGDSDLTHKGALICGSAPVLIWPGMDGMAEITVEDPSQVIIAYEPGSRRKRRAALKRWIGDDGLTYATVYMPDFIYKFRTVKRTESGLVIPGHEGKRDRWVARDTPGEPWPLPNPTGVVPFVEVRANPSLEASPFGGGCSEFEGQINEQRKINQTVMNMLVTMEYQAFRQRWVTGWDYPTHENGTPDRAAMVKAGAARLMVFDADTKVGEFSQADFRPFIDTIDMWVKAIATTSGTPPYAFLLGNMINVAADSLARIEGIQTGKLLAHSRTFGEAWVEVMRMALTIEGNKKAKDPSITVVWGEFEERTATEQANLAQMAKSLGAPAEAAFALFPGVDQTEAKRWKTEALADGLRVAAVAPQAPPQQVAPVAP